MHKYTAFFSIAPEKTVFCEAFEENFRMSKIDYYSEDASRLKKRKLGLI